MLGVSPDSPDCLLQPVPACFGVACRLRAGCARYAAVALTQADRDTLPTCVDGDRFPLFMDLAAAHGAASSDAKPFRRERQSSIAS
jgi:hypothetical protein